MPIYTYKCDACENMYDKRQSFSDPYDSECPVCGEPVRRLINQVGVVFKGSGFYVTDSRGKNSAAALPTGTSGSSADDTRSADGKSADANGKGAEPGAEPAAAPAADARPAATAAKEKSATPAD